MCWEEAVKWLIDQPECSKLVHDAYFDMPLLDAAKRYRNSEEWKSIRAILGGRTGRALDVGAGRGIASYALSLDGFNVTALEPNPSSFVGADTIRSLAKDANISIEVCTEISEKIPFPDGFFDVVFARAALHHSLDMERACAEFFRVLKPDGVFLAVREHVISKKADLHSFLQSHPLHHLYGGENAYLLDEYIGTLRHSGFADIRVIAPLESPINYYPYTMDEVKQKVADKFGIFSQALNLAFSKPFLWVVVQKILDVFDKRPGRLYSFFARKCK